MPNNFLYISVNDKNSFNPSILPQHNKIIIYPEKQQNDSIQLMVINENGIKSCLGGSASTYPTLTLGIPKIQNNGLLNLILDIDTSDDGSFQNYFRISSKNLNQRQHMKWFNIDHFENLPENGINSNSYNSNIVLTINNQIFPNYQLGKIYYARYTYVDSNNMSFDWIGFKFSNDVTDLSHNYYNYGQDSLSSQITQNTIDGNNFDMDISDDITVNSEFNMELSDDIVIQNQVNYDNSVNNFNMNVVNDITVNSEFNMNVY